jgi:hypothetical protein
MPTPSASERLPELRSQVITGQPTTVVLGALTLCTLFAVLAVKGLRFREHPGAVWFLLALGAALAVGGWLVLRRFTHPMLLTCSADALQLTPLERSERQGIREERVPLAAIRSYRQHLDGNGAGLNLTLGLADGRTLRIAQRATTAITHLPGTVPLPQLAQVLRQQLAPTVEQQPNFYQSKLATLLAGLCILAGGWVLVRLAMAHSASGWQLLIAVVIYLGAYSRNRSLAAASQA